MDNSTQWTQLADDATVQTTISALETNNIHALVVDTGEQAKQKVLEMIPQGAEVMNTSSVTVDSIGLSDELNESGKYDSVKNKLNKMDRATQNNEMQKLGAAPDWVVGSVHAVTQDGKVFIASRSGSQIPAYSYGSSHVVWIVGVQKIVENQDEAMKRIYDYVLPLESERVKAAYGMTGSKVAKLLIFNDSITQDRITLIFVKEKLGY